VPSCTSYKIFNGIASGNSDVKFYGKIVVAPDAQKTEAYQTNRNIIVSDGARAESKPQLEIYADDVKCSHGATVGQLNEDEQFYMRSRGIPEDEAKVLQMISFIAPVLSRISDGSVRSSLGTVIGDAVRKL
jgi:Fe-S cluster assembly protein SufD